MLSCPLLPVPLAAHCPSYVRCDPPTLNPVFSAEKKEKRSYCRSRLAVKECRVKKLRQSAAAWLRLVTSDHRRANMQAHSDAADERLTVRLQWAAPQPIRRCAAILQRREAVLAWRTAPREIIVAVSFFSRQTLCTCQLILKPLFQLEIFI